jgi:hypothetical protein
VILSTREYAEKRSLLLAEAIKATAQYPQYQGHYDGHVLVQVVEDVQMKGGTLQAGVALASPVPRVSPLGITFTVFDNVRHHQCAVPQTHLRFVAVDPMG